MPTQAEPPYTHGTPERCAVLLVNLGTPNAPTVKGVKPYLRQFLSDQRVVEIPRLIWWLILNGIILNVRPGKSAAKYASVWMPEGSPLKVHTERQTNLLRNSLSQLTGDPSLVVDYAMRYGSPSISSTLQKLKEQNCQRILLVPMYPQYASSATGTVCDVVFSELSKQRNIPALRTIKHFHDNHDYIAAIAKNIREYWTLHGHPDKLVMSFHGLPRYTLTKGDPYHCECQKSGRLIAEALQLNKDQYVVSFQSRFGRTEWLQPYTTTVLKNLGAEKTRRVDVVCPGFVADCLETLEEIAMEGKEDFKHAGGGNYHYIPCLNEQPVWIDALTNLVLENMHGWLSKSKVAELEESRLRAMAIGADS
jgi:ferrochelatase